MDELDPDTLARYEGYSDDDIDKIAIFTLISRIRALEAERDALRKSVDQLADTLKNVHEAVCEALGIEGDDALPELVEGWAEWEYATLRKDAERYQWLSAEHDRIDPLAAVVWKSSGDRHGSQWCNTINAEDLARAIDARIAAIAAKDLK